MGTKLLLKKLGDRIVNVDELADRIKEIMDMAIENEKQIQELIRILSNQAHSRFTFFIGEEFFASSCAYNGFKHGKESGKDALILDSDEEGRLMFWIGGSEIIRVSVELDWEFDEEVETIILLRHNENHIQGEIDWPENPKDDDIITTIWTIELNEIINRIDVTVLAQKGDGEIFNFRIK